MAVKRVVVWEARDLGELQDVFDQLLPGECWGYETIGAIFTIRSSPKVVDVRVVWPFAVRE